MATRNEHREAERCRRQVRSRRPGRARIDSQHRGRLLLLAAASLAWASPPTTAAEPATPSYGAEIAPLLARNCVACHSPSTRMGGLLLDSFDGLARGGTRGPAVVAGNSERSPLYLMVSGRMEPRMPFSADPLGPAEIDLVRRWIEAGAPGPSLGSGPVATAASGRLPRIEPAVPVKPQIFSLAFHPEGRLLAAGRHGGVSLANAGTGREIAFLDGLPDIARAVAFSPDGRLLAAGGGHPQRGGRVQIWKVAERRPAIGFGGHKDTIQALAFSPDARKIATASYDKDIRLWDAASGVELRTLRDHIDAVYSLAFSPDGRLLASGSADRSVKIWNPETGERLYTLSGPTDGITSIAIDPSGTRLAAGGYDRTIRVWNLGEDGGHLLNSLIAHQSTILQVAYSPAGDRIVTAGADQAIKVFDAETLGELATLDGQSDWVMSLSFSPGGSRLAAGRFDGSLSIYDTESYGDLVEAANTSRKSP